MFFTDREVRTFCFIYTEGKVVLDTDRPRSVNNKVISGLLLAKSARNSFSRWICELTRVRHRLNMKISSHLRNFYQVFSVVACPYLNLGVKSAQNCNADVSDPDERSAELGNSQSGPAISLTARR